MDFQRLLEIGADIIHGHWQQIVISVVSIFLGAFWGRWRARRAWIRKEFLDRINFSLNSVVDNTLRIRTLIEKNTSDVFLNKLATQKVIDATSRTNAQSALLPLDPEDRWFLLNALLNELSEKYSDGLLRKDLGLPVKTATYLVCLTYESAGDLRTRKVRAMVVQKSFLLNLPQELPNFERPHHKTRWNTLHQLAATYGKEPDHFLEVELSVSA